MTCGSDGNQNDNMLERCVECRAVVVCNNNGECLHEHQLECPLIQRPHTSYRTHGMYISRALLESGDYVIWQKGKYVKMEAHLQGMYRGLSKQLHEGKGELMTYARRELGWPKTKIEQGLAGMGRYDLEMVRTSVLRRAFMMPRMPPDPEDPSTKHPKHSFHRKTANLECMTHRGHCASCGVECCVSRAIELELLRTTNHPDEVTAMTSLRREIARWARRRDQDIMQQCTDCVAEGNAWKYYCPDCFGVCPLGQGDSGPVCGDVLCAKHQSVLNHPCDWHTVDE